MAEDDYSELRRRRQSLITQYQQYQTRVDGAKKDTDRKDVNLKGNIAGRSVKYGDDPKEAKFCQNILKNQPIIKNKSNKLGM